MLYIFWIARCEKRLWFWFGAAGLVVLVASSWFVPLVSASDSWNPTFAAWWSAILTVIALGLVWMTLRPPRQERGDVMWPALYAALLVLPMALGQWQMWMPGAWAGEALMVSAAWWLKRQWTGRQTK